MPNLLILSVEGDSFDSWEPLNGCRYLESLSGGTGADVSSTEGLAAAAPLLLRLQLVDCPLLLCAVSTSLHWLTSLCIDSCGVLGSVDVTGVEDLVDVLVVWCKQLRSMHVGSAVRCVEVMGCHALPSIDLVGVTSLEKMTVLACEALQTLQLPDNIEGLRELMLFDVSATCYLDWRA